MSEGNGETQVQQLIITRDAKTGAVTIGGNVTDIELSLEMLSRVTRYLDVQYRIMAAIDAQQEVKKRQEEFRRVQQLLGKA